MLERVLKSRYGEELALPAASGVLLGISFPPLPLGFLAHLSLIPLIYSLRRCSLGESIRRGAVFALVYHLISLHFILFNKGATPFLAITSYLGLVLLMILTGPIFAVPTALAFRRWGDWAVLTVPFFWSVVEYLRSLGETAFPWNILPLTQAYYLAPIQMVSYTGIWGLSFWVTGTNALILLAVKRWKPAFIAAGIWIAFPIFMGHIALKNPPEPVSTLRVLIVQGNVEATEKWARGLSYSVPLYREMTRKYAGDSLDMALWPETAVPGYIRTQFWVRRLLTQLSDEIGCPIATGALDSERNPDGSERNYNSLFLIHPDGRLDSYDKIHLVPFGERVPFQKLFPSLGKLNFGQAEFTPGDEYYQFRLDGAAFGGLICFESVMPKLSWRYIKEGAGFLVNVTNDGWYGKTAEPHQHALLTRFRAIENRRSLLRAANTGISYIADGQGRFLDVAGLEVSAAIVSDFPIYEGRTFYQKHGDLFIRWLIIISLFILAASILLFLI